MRRRHHADGRSHRVRRHRHKVRVRQVGDLARFEQPSALLEIRHDDVHRALLQQLAEAPAHVDVLSAADGRARGVPDVRAWRRCYPAAPALPATSAGTAPDPWRRASRWSRRSARAYPRPGPCSSDKSPAETAIFPTMRSISPFEAVQFTRSILRRVVGVVQVGLRRREPHVLDSFHLRLGDFVVRATVPARRHRRRSAPGCAPCRPSVDTPARRSLSRRCPTARFRRPSAP